MNQYDVGDYDGRVVEAARRVLLELSRVLGEYEEGIVVVGGWVPPLLVPGAGHVGSTDVDLALDHRTLQEPRYATIRALLERNGYYSDEVSNYVYYRQVTFGDGGTPDPVTVEVDLVAAEYGLAGRKRQSQPVQNLRARKARGADLAFDRTLVEEIPMEGRLPSGAFLRKTIRVAGPVPFLVMKANALVGRDKPKDAYDVWFLLANHPAGLDGLADAIGEHADHGLVREAMAHLNDAFASPDHVGPRAVADFLGYKAGTEEHDLVRQDAFQRVWHVLSRVQQK